MIVAHAGWRDETPGLIREDLSAVVIAYGIAEVRTGSRVGTGWEELVRFLKFWRRWRLHRGLLVERCFFLV